MSSSTLNITEQVPSVPHKPPIRMTRAQFRALSDYHQAIALVYLRRGTGEVELVEDAE